MTKEHIAVRVPCGWTITPNLAAALVKLKELALDKDCPYHFSIGFVINMRPVDFARNQIVKEFLTTDATRLWMMDSDIIPHERAGSILKIDADIAGGLYPIWGLINAVKNDGTVRHGDKCEVQWCIYDWNDTYQAWNAAKVQESGVHECDAMGTGMIVIRREVLENPLMRYDTEYTGFSGVRRLLGADDPPPIFKESHKPNGQFDATEDLDFCYRAKLNGYSIKADHGVKCGHVKTANVVAIMDFALAAYGKGFVDAKEQGEGIVVAP